MLQEMNKASQSLNYELAFINITKQGAESLRYRHALENQQVLAQLLQMDGPRRRWCCVAMRSATSSRVWSPLP